MFTGSGGFGLGPTPAPLAFGADAGAFAALGGQDVGVACVGVAPAQVVLQPAGQDGVAGMVRAADDEGAQRPEVRFDRVGPRRADRSEAQLDVLAPGPAADGGSLVR